MSGSLHELKCVHRLVHVIGRWGDVSDDESVSVTSEGLLKKPGKFRLTKGSDAFRF